MLELTKQQKQEVVNQYNALVASGVGPTAAANQLGYGYQTIYGWRNSKKYNKKSKPAIISESVKPAAKFDMINKTSGKVFAFYGSALDVAKVFSNLN